MFKRSPVPAIDAQSLQTQLLPNISMASSTLVINGKSFSLRRRPLTKRLTEAFVDNPDGFVTKDQLLRAVYGAFNPESKSDRFRNALAQNINKLLSRARVDFEKKFNTPGQKAWIEFFIYCDRLQAWSFYRLSNDHLRKIDHISLAYSLRP